MRGEVAKQVQKEPGQLVLIFGGKILKDEDTLETHNIKDNNSVHLVIKNQRQVCKKIDEKKNQGFMTMFRNQAHQKQKQVRQHQQRQQVSPHHSHLVVLHRQVNPVPIHLLVNPTLFSHTFFTQRHYFLSTWWKWSYGKHVERNARIW